MSELVAKMVGRNLTQRFPEKTNTPGEVILQVKNLTAKNQPSIQRCKLLNYAKEK